MAMRPARNLFYLYLSKNNLSKLKFFSVSSRFLHTHFTEPKIIRDFHIYGHPVPTPPQFSSLWCNQWKRLNLFHFYGHPFSTVVDNGDNELEICDLDVEENECENGALGSEKRLNFVQTASRDPVEIYRELREATTCEKQTRADWHTLIEIFRCFAKSGWASNQALAVYIGASFFPTAALKFQNFFLKKCKVDVVKYLVSLGPCIEAEKFLFPIFVEFCLEEFPDEIKNFRKMVESADLTKPLAKGFS